MPRYVSKRKSSKQDVWTTEIRVKKTTRALDRLLRLVRKYEEVS